MISASACSPETGGGTTVERTVVGGIEHVTIRGADVPLEWAFQPEVVIAPELDGELRFGDISPWEVGADRRGRVYALDAAGGRVVVFGRSGRAVGVVGRPGEGPGELSEPAALAVSAEGEVAVYDFSTGGVVRWGPSGSIPPLERLPEPFWGPELGLARWGFVYPSLAPDRRDGRVVRLVVAAATRTGTLAEMIQATVSASFPRCGIGGLPVEPIFEPQLRWALGGDVVAVAASARYEIELSRDGVPERKIGRDVAGRPASRDLALQEVRDGYELTAPVRCRISPSELVEARGFADTVPAISGLAVAPDGSLWVRRAVVTGEGDPPIDVFGPDGAYLGTLPAGSPFPVAFAGRATDYRIVSIRSADTGTSELVVFSIARQGDTRSRKDSP